jgi:hypothetical protein
LYEAKYGDAMYNGLIQDEQNIIGKLITGGMSNLCRMLMNRIKNQPERDAEFLHDFVSKGLSIDGELV